MAVKYSKLKNEIEIMELNHKHELSLLEMQQQQKVSELLNACTHKYDDGSNAWESTGNQWDFGSRCPICFKSL